MNKNPSENPLDNWRVLHHDSDHDEELSDVIDELSPLSKKVLRIKEVIDDRDGKSDEVVLESLRQLQLKPLSVAILEETKIGISVNALRKHGSKKIRNLVRTLIKDWKHMVEEEWLSATADIPGDDDTNESAKSTVDDDEEEGGLPSPPMDEGALLADLTSINWSHFFDGMDDDGNLIKCGESKNQQKGKTLLPERTSLPMHKVENQTESRTPPNDLNGENQSVHESTTKKESPPPKPIPQGTPKPSGTETSARKPRQATNNVVKKLNRINEIPDQMRFEAAKRRLHENYQEAENAKKQRTIQVIELCDIPKHGLSHRNQKTSRNSHRQRGSRRLCVS